MEAPRRAAAAQFLACAAVRVLSNAVGVAFFIWVIAGGLDAYAGTYDASGRSGSASTSSEGGTLVLTVAGLLVWGAFASAVQVGVYRRGLRDWPAAGEAATAQPPVDAGRTGGGSTRARWRWRRRSRFALLLPGTEWPLLGGGGRLAGRGVARVPPGQRRRAHGAGARRRCWPAARWSSPWPAGSAWTQALRRAARAALLVLVATWLRAAAGRRRAARGVPAGARPAAARCRRCPRPRDVLDRIGSEGRLTAAGRALARVARAVSTPPAAAHGRRAGLGRRRGARAAGRRAQARSGWLHFGWRGRLTWRSWRVAACAAMAALAA